VKLNQSVDIYCERISPEIFSEPVNFFSNFAFWITFFLLLKKHNKKNYRDEVTRIYSFILIILVFLIGAGSFLFHLFGNLWSLLADTISIMIFIILYLYLAVRFYLGQTLFVSAFAILFFLILNYLLSYLGIKEISSYLIALLSMLIISYIAYSENKRDISYGLLLSSVIFTLSLGFRQLDLFACAQFSLGTHWIWHILNSILLYTLVLLFIERKVR
tara:strand:+ start:2514 stop:3164 length:651 start_codon:yes stop_codon:yes gene_type:complete